VGVLEVVADPGDATVTDPQPLIEVDHVSLAYTDEPGPGGHGEGVRLPTPQASGDAERFLAVDDVSFQVNRGETVAMIGRNGAGKTTMMKVVARVLPPTEGRVVVRGVVAPMIALGAGFNHELNAIENIVLFGTLLGRDPEEMRERAKSIGEWAELTDFLDVPIRSYSSGMMARLGFAVAADVDPDVMVVDEVLSVGDESFQRKSFEKMQSLMKGGTAVLLVSHVLDKVLEVADRVIWLQKGRIQMEPAIPKKSWRHTARHLADPL
jgi:ABC-type polysaccharide/polyol phosphate transport system ATPase subunit